MLTDLNEWERDAACRNDDTRRWFSREPEDIDYAINVCWDCPVREDCLEWALAKRVDFGILGAMDEDERRALRRRVRGVA